MPLRPDIEEGEIIAQIPIGRDLFYRYLRKPDGRTEYRGPTTKEEWEEWSKAHPSPE